MAEDEILQDNTADAEPEIYVGPNILAFGIMKFQVYRGGLPPYVERAIEKIPEIRGLIVPVSELEATRQKIARPGTNESRLHDSVAEDSKKFNAEYRKGRRRR